MVLSAVTKPYPPVFDTATSKRSKTSQIVCFVPFCHLKMYQFIRIADATIVGFKIVSVISKDQGKNHPKKKSQGLLEIEVSFSSRKRNLFSTVWAIDHAVTISEQLG